MTVARSIFSRTSPRHVVRNAGQAERTPTLHSRILSGGVTSVVLMVCGISLIAALSASITAYFVATV
ncbi:MAG: hypothetical protein OXL36_14235 [Bryobacterales bacterium]|nr:hypothetical protein [Bryobacterales bacterium]MDE0293681.1 hypothetical protein [Bryobacterales bacterium]